MKVLINVLAFMSFQLTPDGKGRAPVPNSLNLTHTNTVSEPKVSFLILSMKVHIYSVLKIQKALGLLSTYFKKP